MSGKQVIEVLGLKTIGPYFPGCARDWLVVRIRPARVVMLSRSRKLGQYPEARRPNCVFGTIQASVALLVLLSLVHPSRAFAANPEQDTALTGSRQRIEKLDYR